MHHALTHWRRICAAVLAASAAAAILVSATAWAAELNAGPSNLGSVFGGAAGGDTILLASGNYGTFGGAMKGGEVTLKSAPGAAVTMRLDFNPASNITLDGLTLTEIEISGGSTRNITVRNADIPGQTTFRTGELQNANILFENNVHRDWNACSSCGEGRIFLPERTDQPSGITIQNSEFRGGLSDGIQNGSRGTRILNNTFHDLKSGTADGVHADAIQLYGSANTQIKGNFFYALPHGVGQIMAPDGADHEVIEDNVFAPLTSGDQTRPFAIDLFSDDGSVVRHNTLADGRCEFNLRCGIVRIGSKSSCSYADECDAGRGTIIEDNILGEVSDGGGSAVVARNAFNLFTNRTSGISSLKGQPSFVGGVTPTTYAGYALAAGSPGRGSASDGLDRGIRLGAGSGTPAPTAPARLSVRVLSSLKSIRRTGRLRVRITTPGAGRHVVSGKVRPGNALRGYRNGHSRAVIKLKTASLGARRGEARTATFKLGRKARRRLGRSRSARLTVSVRIDGQVTTKKVAIKR